MELEGASATELRAYKAKAGGGGDDDNSAEGEDGDNDGFQLPEGFALAEGETDEGVAAAVDASTPVPGDAEDKIEVEEKKIEETVFPHEIDKPEHMRRPFPVLQFPVCDSTKTINMPQCPYPSLYVRIHDCSLT